jgi:uncharacterized membrane protein
MDPDSAINCLVMPTDEQYEELLRLISSLTERIYKLEQRLGDQSAGKEDSNVGTDLSLSPKAATPSVQNHQKPKQDLESRIGGHWLNRIGIVAVLIGVSYFLKYAFENEWVGPAGRVMIGIVGALAVLVWSDFVRRSGYVLFSYSLKAIGLGVLYLCLWASSEVYGLVPYAIAFAAMVGVSAATIVIALWEDAEVIAAFSALGAFLTPAVLSTSENNAASLFGYLAVLDIGALILGSYRGWIRILIGSFIGTVLFYSSWNVRFYSTDQFTVALVSVTAFFLIFAATPFVQRGRLTVISALALANAAAYFFEAWQLFYGAVTNRQSAGAAVVLAAFYFLMAAFLNKTSADAVITNVHWSIGATLLLIVIPVAFDAHWITIGWLVEGAALVDVGERTRHQMMRVLGGVGLACGVCRLLAFDHILVTRVLLNERMMVSTIAIAALAFAASKWIEARGVLIVTINVIALAALNREIADAFQGTIRDFAYSALLMLYGAGMMIAGFWKNSRFLRWQALILIGITVCKVFLYDTSSLDRGYRVLSLIALGLVLLATSFLYQRDWFKLQEK